MRRLISGSLALAFVLASATALAMPKQVCEQWQDYLYFRATGEFLAWLGQPYQVCWTVGSGRPESDLDDTDRTDDTIKGGGGEPISSRCNDCKGSRAVTVEQAKELKKRCESDAFRLGSALCASGKRRGRPVGEPIPPDIKKRVRVCEDTASRRVCRWETESEPNPEFSPCLNEWSFGFSDEEISTERNRSGQHIDIGPETISFKWDGKTQVGYLGASQSIWDLCAEPFQDELNYADREFEECADRLEQVVRGAGYENYQCHL